jgi:hypothetical protein
VADGSFTVITRDGSRHVTHLTFGPGPFVVDLDGASLTATLQDRSS